MLTVSLTGHAIKRAEERYGWSRSMLTENVRKAIKLHRNKLSEYKEVRIQYRFSKFVVILEEGKVIVKTVIPVLNTRLKHVKRRKRSRRKRR